MTLRDASSQSSATVLVGFGFNCFEFCAVRQGRAVDVLWSAPGFAGGGQRASGSGIPLLFPFPGRMPGTVFRWEGREYLLNAGDGRGNAIHGFVLDRPWRLVERTACRVTGEFQASVDDPRLLERWPADFRLRVTYRLAGETLSTEIVIDNPDHRPLPFGFGTHPYFRVPLGGPRAEDCTVRWPVAHRWELVNMLPTGRRLEDAELAAYRAGVEFRHLQVDDVFGGLQFEGDWCAAEIRDPGSGAAVTLRFDRAFRECVVYTPPHREAICIEPYTCVPGACELARQGIDGGFRVLAPGASFRARVEIRVD